MHWSKFSFEKFYFNEINVFKIFSNMITVKLVSNLTKKKKKIELRINIEIHIYLSLESNFKRLWSKLIRFDKLVSKLLYFLPKIYPITSYNH